MQPNWVSLPFPTCTSTFPGSNTASKANATIFRCASRIWTWKDLFKALKNAGAAGRILCESPILEEDALYMQKLYEEVKS